MANSSSGSPSAAALLQNLPVRNAAHFSLCKKKGGVYGFRVVEPATYIALHDRTLPPPDQGAQLQLLSR